MRLVAEADCLAASTAGSARNMSGTRKPPTPSKPSSPIAGVPNMARQTKALSAGRLSNPSVQLRPLLRLKTQQDHRYKMKPQPPKHARKKAKVRNVTTTAPALDCAAAPADGLAEAVTHCAAAFADRSTITAAIGSAIMLPKPRTISTGNSQSNRRSTGGTATGITGRETGFSFVACVGVCIGGAD